MLPHGAVVLLVLLNARLIHALGVLLPLYVYPDANCAAWTQVKNAISATPNTRWYIIVNPDNGPGPTDTLYQNCVAALPASANQVIMGYVDTQAANVDNDIDTYAGWAAAARPAGIFLDGINPTASGLSTYQGYVSHAKSAGFTFIGLDPGETVSSSYLDLGDLVNTYEDDFSSFSASELTGTLSKQSVYLMNAPATGSYSAVIAQLESMGVAAVYISDLPDTSSDLPAQLSEFVGEVASASGSASSSPSSSGTKPSSGTSSGTSSSGTSSSGTASSGGAAVTGKSPSGTASPPSSGSPSSASSATGQQNLGSSSVSGQPSTPSGNSSNPTQPSAGSAASTHHGLAVGAIVGGTIGALALLLILVAFLCVRRRRRSRVTTWSPEAGVASPFKYDPTPDVPTAAAPDTNAETRSPGTHAQSATSPLQTEPSFGRNTGVKSPAEPSSDAPTLPVGPIAEAHLSTTVNVRTSYVSATSAGGTMPPMYRRESMAGTSVDDPPAYQF